MLQPTLKLPFKGRLICLQSSNYENGSHNKKYKNTRYALDFALDSKKLFKILASADGKVKIWKCCKHNSGRCKCGLGFGNQIRIYHSNYFTFYAHLDKIIVDEDDFVKQGETIGLVGKSGLAGEMTHLHFTLGKEFNGGFINGKFIPFLSVRAKKIEIIEDKKKKLVSSTYFKEGEMYTSTNYHKFVAKIR